MAEFLNAVRATVTRNGIRDEWELRIYDAAEVELWLWALPEFSDFYNASERFPPGLDHVGPRLNGVGVGYRSWKGSAGEGGWRADLAPLALR